MEDVKKAARDLRDKAIAIKNKSIINVCHALDMIDENSAHIDPMQIDKIKALAVAEYGNTLDGINKALSLLLEEE